MIAFFSMLRSLAAFGASLGLLATLASPAHAQRAPIAVKVVVVTMFEIGKLTGDKPGEAQFWVEREKLDRVLPFPLGEYELRMNDAGLLLICTGGGVTNSSTSIMALGLDPRFDLSKAYWLIAGIAGGDPLDVSLGTAAWAKHVVDGDLLYEIDAREIPADWPYGMLPLGAKRPNDTASGWTVDTIHYALNAQLADWAYAITKDHPIADSPGIAQFRAQYAGYPAATRPPFVTMGDSLSSSKYWHGERMNQWANDWMKLQAGKDANFMMANMEDSGTLTALRRLSRVGRVDLKGDARNTRSRTAMARIGATFEGVLRQWQPSLVVGEETLLRDTAMYSVTADEWPTVRSNLEMRIA